MKSDETTAAVEHGEAGRPGLLAGWSREAVAGAAVAAAMLAGVALDSFVGDVAARRVAPASAFVSGANFCPAAPKGGTSTATLLLGAPGPAATVGLEPVEKEKLEVRGDVVTPYRVAKPVAVDAVGYGAAITASTVIRTQTPVEGAGAAVCASSAAQRWYLPEGSSELGFDERILVYNPFPDEAVIAVTLFTPGGRKAKANLSDVAVPARSSVGLAVNDYILRQGVLGASVVARRGRIVVWRSLMAKPDGLPHGTQLSLASQRTSTDWFFPDGGVGPGYEERITVLNPAQEEAVLTISLVAGKEVIQPPKLVEVTVPPGTARAFWLPNLVGGTDARIGGAGAVVRSINGTGVVAERTVWYDTGDAQGVASEVGAPEAARDWWVPPASLTPTTDSIVLLNPTTRRATVSIRLLRTSGASVVPRALQGVVVPSYARVRLPVAALTGGAAVAAIVTSDTPVVAERSAYSSAAGDVSSVIGVPLNRLLGAAQR